MSQETIKIEDLKCVELRPNDTLVVKLPGRCPAERVERLGQRLKKVFPDNEFIILDAGTEMFVVHHGEQPFHDSSAVDVNAVFREAYGVGKEPPGDNLGNVPESAS